MKTQHTPGPWEASKDSVVWASSKTVARCDIGGRDEETYANARLIAAAPELLEALNMALNFQNSIRDVGLFGSIQAERLRLRGTLEQAIRKATGK